MSNANHIIARTEEFVFDLFKRMLPEDLVYHTYAHSESVAKSARKLAKATALGEGGIEVVVLAALLHDTGYTEVYIGHEEVSVTIAAKFLRGESYSEENIEVILGCIQATKVPQQPKNILEEIVADADLSSFGKKSFFKQGDLLRIEWERAQGRYYTDEQWLETSITLLSKHTFFTRVAQQRYGAQQAENLRRLYKAKSQVHENVIVEVPTEVIAAESPVPNASAELDVRMQQMLMLGSQSDQRSQFLFVVSLLMSIFGVVAREWGAVPMITSALVALAALLFAARSLSHRLSLRPIPSVLSSEQTTLRSATLRRYEDVLRTKERLNQTALVLLVISAIGVVARLLLQ